MKELWCVARIDQPAILDLATQRRARFQVLEDAAGKWHAKQALDHQVLPHGFLLEIVPPPNRAVSYVEIGDRFEIVSAQKIDTSGLQYELKLRSVE